MKRLTIRGVNDQLHGALREAAAKERLSVNRYVLRLLGERLGLLPEVGEVDASFDDLDHLAGTWTNEEGGTFLREVGQQRETDTGPWK